jgi:hypothetical protein
MAMPNNAQGNLLAVQVEQGDRVQLLQPLRRQYRLNTNDTFDLEMGEVFEVTRVMSGMLNVRTIETRVVTEVRNYSQRQVDRRVSFSIGRDLLAFEDPNYVPPPPPRKLGVTPEHKDLPNLDPSVPIVSITDPGIQWLFDDMGKYADEQGYCSQYDALCVKLGIPGRPRDFAVDKTVNGLSFRTTVKARSQREANELVEAALFPKTEAETTPPAPEPQAA